MEVRIGVQHATRELVIDSAETTDAILAAVTAAVTGEASVLTLTDERGRQVLVPSDKLAYVEVGEPESRRVGFGLWLISSCTARITPGVQKPHCSPWVFQNASWIGWSVPAGARPSIVVTALPSTCTARQVQDRTAAPSSSTVHAPH